MKIKIDGIELLANPNNDLNIVRVFGSNGELVDSQPSNNQAYQAVARYDVCLPDGSKLDYKAFGKKEKFRSDMLVGWSSKNSCNIEFWTMFGDVVKDLVWLD